MNMEKKTYCGLDCMKFISACFVICIHTGPLLDINKDANFVLVQIISRIAVPFFFVASGFLFFNKINLLRCWNDYENLHNLRHYVGRLFKMYCIWTIVYLPFTYILFRNGDGLQIVSLLRYVRDFFITGSYYHLWFLPALMFAVPFVYMLICKWGIKVALIIGGVLYAIGMGLNVYPQVLENTAGVGRVVSMYISIFSTARNGLFFGTIFVGMGAFFAKRSIYVKKYQIVLGLLISIILYTGECFLLRDSGIMNDLTSMYSMLLPCLFFLFLMLLRVNVKKRPVFKTMRALSLLIYVSHIMFTLGIQWLYPSMNSLNIYVFTVVCSFIFSYIVYRASKNIRFLTHLYE